MSSIDELNKEFEYQKKHKLNGVAPVHYEGEQDGLKVTTNSHLGGLAWLFTNKKGDTLSVICHTGSYGRHSGLFEIMPSRDGDDVEGHLTCVSLGTPILLLIASMIHSCSCSLLLWLYPKL